MCEAKGIHIALEVCKRLGVKLKVAGQVSDEFANYEWPDFVELVGYADIKKRTELMRNAAALILASIYVEPFGGVQIETLLSGTPTITTDWGAFAENNIHGVTGYRCRTLDDFLNATMDCLDGKIKPEDCRKQGEKFSLDNIAPMYEKAFTDISHIYDGTNGWYCIEDDTLKRMGAI